LRRRAANFGWWPLWEWCRGRRCAFAERQDQVGCGCVAARESEAQLETAEAALRVRRCGEDYYDAGVEDGVEYVRGECGAVVDCGGVEEGEVA